MRTGESNLAGGILVFMVTLGVLGFLAVSIRVMYNYITVLQELFELMAQLQLKAISKMVLSLLQIVGSFTMALNVDFPVLFSGMIEAFMSVFKMDLASMIKLGCVTSGAYVSSLLGQLVLLIVLSAIIGALYFHKQQKATDELEHGSPEVQRAHVKDLYDRFDIDGDGIEMEVRLVVSPHDLSHGHC